MPSFLEYTPRDIANIIGISGDKKAEPNLMNEFKNLPVTRKGLKVVGLGDWGKGSSSKGSCVLSIPDTEAVLKMPLGETGMTKQEAMELAVELKQTANLYDSISPETCFVITSDGPNNHKVVTIQREIKGKPASETSIRELIKISANGGFDEIMTNIINVVKTNGLYDLSGLLYKDCSKVFDRIRNYLFKIPWFSDNIMIEDSRKCYLTDNTPKSVGHKIPSQNINRHSSQINNYWNIVKKISIFLDKFV